MTKANESAFPLITEWRDSNGHTLPGLTKRELAAMMAMQGLLSNWEWMRGLDKRCLDAGVSMETGVAIACRSYADALLKELEKETK